MIQIAEIYKSKMKTRNILKL